jgi:signal transduction histidine kinase
MKNYAEMKHLNVDSPRWRLLALIAACAIIYYLSNLIAVLGLQSANGFLSSLHNFYGLDFYALVFFIPVVYAAYAFGIREAVLLAVIAVLVILPQAIAGSAYPNSLLRPAAFGVILSAVGATIALLQRNDQQRKEVVRELRCLYNIGKAADEAKTTEAFLTCVVDIVQSDIQLPKGMRIRIKAGDKQFFSAGFREVDVNGFEYLEAAGKRMGTLEVCYPLSKAESSRKDSLSKALAERISGVLRRIELEQDLKQYSLQLEDMVKSRTKDLEQAIVETNEMRDKLIRSERLAAVGELASSIGHELRNPLNVVRNCVYLIKMTQAEKMDNETAETLTLLDRQVDISNRIVTDLLDFTRVKEPNRSRVNLARLMRDTLKEIEVKENVQVINEIEDDQIDLQIDPDQIGRAFLNLILNAIQSLAEKGFVKISAGLNADQARIVFEDNGCGITEQNLAKLFEPLFTTKAKGLGLGLAITRRLIEQNGGSIKVTSAVGEGSVFTVTLPVDGSIRG